MLSAVTWLGKEVIRVGMTGMHPDDVVVRLWAIGPTCGMLIGISCSCPCARTLAYLH